MIRWKSPLPLRLIPETDSMGFLSREEGTTGLPVGADHPGAFGYIRANHVHEGIDLYCADGTPVHAVEDGVVVAVLPFTGPSAVPPSPWWHDTQAILVEGASGVVVYGEVGIGTGIREGVHVGAGEAIGHVRRVLVKDKGRPVSMLHLELHRHGTRDAFEWTIDSGRPASLLDPTAQLLTAADAGGPVVPEQGAEGMPAPRDALIAMREAVAEGRRRARAGEDPAPLDPDVVRLWYMSFAPILLGGE